MFCEKCGRQIPGNASKCPGCGADLPGMEYCSGFWVELNQNSQADKTKKQKEPDQKSEKSTSAEKSGNADAKRKKDVRVKEDMKPGILYSVLKYAAIAEGVIILILLIHNAVSGGALQKEMDRQNEDLKAQYEEKSEALQNDYDSISKDFDNLKEEKEQLEKEKKQLEEEKEQLEEELRILNESIEGQKEPIPSNETDVSEPVAPDSGNESTAEQKRQEPTDEQIKVTDPLQE